VAVASPIVTLLVAKVLATFHDSEQAAVDGRVLGSLVITYGDSRRPVALLPAWIASRRPKPCLR
jgi:hypothetical protein